MKKIILSVLFLGLLLMLCPLVYAFEVDGCVTGMSQAEIRNRLAGRNFDRIEEKDNFIRAWDYPDRPTSRWLVFDFCNKKLMKVQKDIYPSMKNFILMFDELSSVYGKPTDSQINKTIDSIGETNTISFSWRTGKDLITLRYKVFPDNEQLSLYYDNTSKCAK